MESSVEGDVGWCTLPTWLWSYSLWAGVSSNYTERQWYWCLAFQARTSTWAMHQEYGLQGASNWHQTTETSQAVLLQRCIAGKMKREFKEFEACVLNNCGQRVSTLQSDNQGEYLSKKFRCYFKRCTSWAYSATFSWTEQRCGYEQNSHGDSLISDGLPANMVPVHQPFSSAGTSELFLLFCTGWCEPWSFCKAVVI